MKLAILFWFYKEPDVCENRLQLIKKFNPELQIFGLFGGDSKETGQYQKKLGKYLDDFYTFDSNSEKNWKWINGDLIILDWYEKRGRILSWDSVVVIQWDALVFDSIENQFEGIEKDQIFLSGLRKLDLELENQWYWTTPERSERENYLNFLKYAKDEYEYVDEPMCCLFIFQIFPRFFFDKYLTVRDREVGMLEYKIPIYAKIFNIPVYERNLGVGWKNDEIRPLNAIPREIKEEYINSELRKPEGWRIFHPYYKSWPDSLL